MNSRTALWLCLFALLVGLLPGAAAAANPEWQWRHPTPQGNDLLAVTHGNGLFVAVGPGGTILASPDGMTWTSRSLGQPAHLRGTAFGNGRFVAVGNDSALFTSEDGRSWTRRPGPAETNFTSVIYDGTQFIATTEKGLLTSPDGTAWTAVAGLSGRFNHVALANGRLMVTGESEGIYLQSESGWTKVYKDSGAFGVAYGAGLYVAGASKWFATTDYYTIVTSPDGINWTGRRPGHVHDRIHDIVYADGKFIGVGSEGKVAISTDGITWTDVRRDTLRTLRGVVDAGGALVAVGDHGTLIRSVDGQAWSTHAGGPVDFLEAVAYGEDRFVAVGENGRILTSRTGEHWEVQESGVQTALRDVTYARGLWVAVGDSGVVLHSTDGERWERVPGLPFLGIGTITYGAGLFVAGGQAGLILTSPDGKAWTVYEWKLDSSRVWAIAYGGGKFVAANQSFYVSVDGVNWTRATEEWGQGALAGLTYGFGAFVAASASGDVFISEDGERWYRQPMRAEPEGNVWVEALTYGDGWFVAVGTYRTNSWSPARPGIFVSRTGDLWRMTDAPLQFTQKAVAYGAGRFVSAGMWGRILTAQSSGLLPHCRELFADVTSQHPACGAIRRLVERRAISGYPDGTFRPDGPVTRAEFVKMLTQALERPLQPDGEVPFSDAKEHWAAKGGYIQAALAMNQSTGYAEPVITGFPDGTFRPDARITRAQLAKMVAVASKQERGGSYVWSPYYDVEETDWFAVYVGMTYRDRISGPYAETPLWFWLMLGPGDEVSRAEAAAIIDNLLAAR